MDKLKTRILLMSMILLLLLSVQAAAAASDGDMGMASENIDLSICDNLDDAKADDVLKAGNTEVLATDEGNFSELKNLIETHYNGNLTLNKSYKCNGENRIGINNPITIYGNGNTIDGNNFPNSGIFLVNSPNVVIHDLIFTNGYGDSFSSGAIYGWHEFTAINCTFTNNNAGLYGGAMKGGTAINCTFTNNKAYNGGAIYDGTAINCTFTNNQAYEGGAIYESNATNCTFTNNYAGRDGGGGAIYDGTAENSIFKDNDLYETSTKNCIFIDATTNTTSIVYPENTVVFEAPNDIPGDIENPVIIFNSANEIVGTAAVTVNGNEITVSGLSNPDDYEICYYKNTAYNDNKNYNRLKVGVLKANSTVFAEDVAVLYGNTISIPVTSTNATNVTYRITNNKGENVTNSTVGPNDAISLSGLPIGKYTVNLTTVVDENHAPASYASQLIITDGTTFWDLNRTINGNADEDVYLDGNYAYNPDVDTDFKDGINIDRKVTIHGNGYTLDGNDEARIFNVKASDAVVQDTIFVHGAAFNGGAMNGGTAENCTFTNNTAQGTGTDGRGGAIYNGNATNCTFNHNTADYGGAIAKSNAENCTFTNNTATYYGGAIYNGNATNCTFTNNHAKYGGAIEDGDATNCTFTNNTANEGGGAMKGGTATNCTFTNNNATQWGGAIFDGDATNCTFTNNTSDDGGAMYNYLITHHKGNAENCTFTNNTASDDGGAMKGGTATNCTFTNNTAQYGGAMEGRSTAINCTFTNNTAKYGGAIYDGDATNSIFKDNRLTNGEYNDLRSSSSENCIFISTNTAQSGNITYPEDTVVFETETAIPDDIERPVIIFNQENEIISDATVKINGTTVTVSGLNTFGNYEICYYYKTINSKGDKNYNRVKVGVLKADITIDPVAAGDLVVDSVVNVTFTLPKDIDGNVSVSIDDEEVVGFAIDNGTVTIPGIYEPGNHTVIVNLTGDTHYNDATGSTTFNIAKGSSTITITDYTSPINIGDDATVAFEINPNVTDNAVTLWINGTEILTYDFEFNNESFLITKDKFPSIGTYNITVQYLGNSRYNASNIASCIITVNKINVTMNVEGSTIVYGENATVTVTGLPDDATGNVSVRVGDGIFFADVKNGTAVIEVPDLIVGNYTGSIVRYSGDSRYNEAYDETTIIVKPASSKIVIDPIDNVTYGEDVVVTYSAENETSLNITVTDADGKAITSGINASAKGKVVISGLDAGKYAIAISNAEEGNYLGSDAEATFNVLRANSSISAPDVEVNYGETISVPVSVVNASEFAYIVVNEKGEIVKSDIIPTGSNITADLPAGTYNVTLITGVDANHNSERNASKITVKPANSSVSTEDANVSYGEAISIAVTSVNATEVYYEIIDSTNKVVANGTVEPDEAISVSGLDAGDYTVNLTTIVNSNYTAANNTSKLHVKHVVSIIIDSISGYAGEIVNFTAEFKYENGEPVNEGDVTLIIRYDEKLAASLSSVLGADDTYSSQVSGGKATFNIKLGDPGTYPYTVTYSSDDTDTVEAESTVQISKLETTVSGEDISGKPADEKSITIDVLNQNDEPVANGTATLTLDGKTYNATVENGKAVFNVELPTPGTYEATIKYNGNDYYEPSESTINVDVEKVNTKAPSAEDISGKAGEKVDITIEIVDENGNPVKNGTATLTIDGKTYTAEVKDGVATFKDVELPEKDTVADVYYQGNEYYNASSTTFSIKIEPENNNTDENQTTNTSSEAVDTSATGNPIAMLMLGLTALVITYRKKN